jgi:hypothetical protein
MIIILRRRTRKNTRKIVINNWLEKMIRATNDDRRQLCPVNMEKVMYEVAATYMMQKR